MINDFSVYGETSFNLNSQLETQMKNHLSSFWLKICLQGFAFPERNLRLDQVDFVSLNDQASAISFTKVFNYAKVWFRISQEILAELSVNLLNLLRYNRHLGVVARLETFKLLPRLVSDSPLNYTKALESICFPLFENLLRVVPFVKTNPEESQRNIISTNIISLNQINNILEDLKQYEQINFSLNYDMTMTGDALTAAFQGFKPSVELIQKFAGFNPRSIRKTNR